MFLSFMCRFFVIIFFIISLIPGLVCFISGDRDIEKYNVCENDSCYDSTLTLAKFDNALCINHTDFFNIVIIFKTLSNEQCEYLINNQYPYYNFGMCNNIINGYNNSNIYNLYSVNGVCTPKDFERDDVASYTEMKNRKLAGIILLSISAACVLIFICEGFLYCLRRCIGPYRIVRINRNIPLQNIDIKSLERNN